MKKVLVVQGPTAVGKSAVGVALAKKFNGEIISGDSIQVYRGLSIGSGKITVDEMDGVTHYGIDIKDPKEAYSVADFQRDGRQLIDDISEKGMIPIIVGGTGLYVKACLYDYRFSKEEVMDTRLYDAMSKEERYELLTQRDSEAASKIHPNNERRVIRALVMMDQQQCQKSDIEQQNSGCLYDILVIGCHRERKLVYELISKRVDKMVEHGLEAEIKQLLDDGVTFDDQSMQGIGYKEWKPYFNGDCCVAEVVEAIKRNSRRYVKRQMTWLNHQIPVTWFDMEDDNWLKLMEKTVQEWLYGV